MALSTLQDETPLISRLNRKSAFGRSLPIFTTACAGQIESKRLVSTDANGWSVAMQMSGQVHAITQQGLCI